MIGERIKQARIACQMSQQKLADRIGVSKMAISKYENNFMVPGSEKLIAFSNTLGIPVDFFLRENEISIEIQAYRKQSSLGIREQERIQMEVQDWLECYFELEELLLIDSEKNSLKQFEINSLLDCEKAAQGIREFWKIGNDPIDNIVDLFEDKNLKVFLVHGIDKFDGCSYIINNTAYAIAINGDRIWDRQRFGLAHELGHLILSVNNPDLDEEKVMNRFAGAFLAPDLKVKEELGEQRSYIRDEELLLLKEKYGLSMQGWMYRAKDLNIISSIEFINFWKRLNQSGWKKKEPDNNPNHLPEIPHRMEKLVYRALAEEIITRSKANELFNKSKMKLIQEN